MNNTKTFIIILVLLVIIISAAYVITTSRGPQTQTIVSQSDELTVIEQELKETDLVGLDAELANIEAEVLR